jgi:hypothetical protein
MEPRFQTSFIPKKPIIAAPVSASHSINLFSLMAGVIFFTTLAACGGVFFYKNLVTKQLADDKTALEKAKASFDPEKISNLIRTNNRIETGKKLFASHIAITPLFDFLSKITLPSIRFRDFSFAYLGKDKIQVQMKGQAQNYAAVALQSDLFNAQEYLKDTVMGDMTLDATGAVLFSVSMVVDPSLTSYAAALTRASAIESSAQDSSSITTP